MTKMPEQWRVSDHKDAQTTSSSSSARSTPGTEVGEQRNPTFEYSLHYTGPVSINRAVALLAREAKDMKRSRSSHGYDRHQESHTQIQSHRSVADHSESIQLVRSRNRSNRITRSQSQPPHSNGREGHYESNRHHGQPCLCSHDHGDGCDPSIRKEQRSSWSTLSDTLCDDISLYAVTKVPLVIERPVPRIERRGPSLYIVREARGRTRRRAGTPDDDPRTSCRIL